MGEKEVQDKASDVEAGDNAVHVQGPADVDVSLTPRAALETARRLGDAAVESIINSAIEDKADDNNA
ncbi:hypothetical protein AB5I39_17275 [Sphingomonas sp. MMS24-J45]|uniref:hypothetical protein n=1 Tax=Sphingomonas sp. MMS24-J45 TaxID=3238806 RepID=UPI00384E8963